MKKYFEKFMEKFQKDERGMTLVELLAVVVILAIVGVIAFVSIGKVIDNSKQDAHVANAQQVISAAELYEASGGKISGKMNATDLDTLENKLINPWTKNSESGDGDYNFTLEKNEAKEIIISSPEIETCKAFEANKTTLSKDGRAICKAND